MLVSSDQYMVYSHILYACNTSPVKILRFYYCLCIPLLLAFAESFSGAKGGEGDSAVLYFRLLKGEV